MPILALAGEGAGCLRGSERKGGLRGEQRDNESPQNGLGSDATGKVEDGRKGRRRDESDMHLTRGQVFEALKPEDKRNCQADARKTRGNEERKGKPDICLRVFESKRCTPGERARYEESCKGDSRACLRALPR